MRSVQEEVKPVPTLEKIYYEHPGTLVPKIAYRYFDKYESLLDVGGGEGLLGVGVWKISRVACLDIFPPKTKPSNFTLGNALDAVSIYGSKSFDVVLCCEVIEHLPKDKGPELLQVLEQVARKIVIVTTPRGFLDQDPSKHPEAPWADNPHQKHLCGYLQDEFMDLGYNVLLNNGIESEDGSAIIAWKLV